MAALRLTESTDQPSDRMLIERTLAGDQDAYALLVERHQRAIYRVAVAIVRDEMDADVVTQDTFVQAYLHLDRFEGRAELETWLTRIAINRARDTLRSRRWLPLRGGHEESGEEGRRSELVDNRPDAERQTASRQLLEAIEGAVERLSAQQRTIFRLRHYEEMPLEKIAQLMRLKPGTVRAHLFRAVRKIRKELEGWLPAGSLAEEILK